MRSIFLTLFSVVCFSVAAQVDDFQKDIINYLNLNGTPQQYGAAYDEMFEVLKRNFSTANIPENVWAELRLDKKSSVDDAISFLSFAYRKHFTQEEIGQLTDFYSSETGQKMVTQNGELTESDHQLIAQFYESAVAKKMEAKKNVLAEDVSEISSHWSRELFGKKMSSLVKKGYTTRY